MVKEDENMSSMTEMIGNMAAVDNYAAKKTDSKSVEKKSQKYGKTVGKPKLSEKAQKYYDELKKKYKGMDFILVSSDMKDTVQANAGKYAQMSNKETVVLIDEEKIERMAVDENYRKKYEGIIQNASNKLSEMSSQLAKAGASVKTVGMQVNDDGTTTLFAVLEKNSSAQKERLEKSAAKKAEQKKADKKAAERKKAEERYKKHPDEMPDDEDTVTIKGNTVEELIQKIQDYVFMAKSDTVETEAEKMVGQGFDLFG